VRFEIELETLKAQGQTDLTGMWSWEIRATATPEDRVPWVFESGQQRSSLREVVGVALSALSRVAARHAESAIKETT
jgi:hypothetical protein